MVSVIELINTAAVRNSPFEIEFYQKKATHATCNFTMEGNPVNTTYPVRSETETGTGDTIFVGRTIQQSNPFTVGIKYVPEF